MRTRYLLFFLFVLLLVYLYSCRKPEVKTGTLHISLTDAPGDFESVNLDIRQVKIHSNLSHPEADWIEMTTNNGVYDMISLSNGTDTLLATGDLPTGPFHALKIELGGNNTVKVNGGVFPLHVKDNRILVDAGTHIRNDEESHLLVDLDVRSSIRMDSAGNYVLFPVIRVSDLTSTGSIKGVVEPAVASCKVYAIAGFDSIAAYAGTNGEFRILGLKPGLYHVTAVPPAPTTPGTVPNVAVTATQEKDIGAVVVGQ